MQKLTLSCDKFKVSVYRQRRAMKVVISDITDYNIFNDILNLFEDYSKEEP